MKKRGQERKESRKVRRKRKRKNRRRERKKYKEMKKVREKERERERACVITFVSADVHVSFRILFLFFPIPCCFCQILFSYIFSSFLM